MIIKAKTAKPRLIFDDIENARAGGKVVYLIGDSIFRGYAVGKFDLPYDHPCFILNSISELINLLSKNNGNKLRACFWGGGMPQILNLNKHCQPGDYVVFEDAGIHPKDFGVLKNYFDSMLGAANLLNGIQPAVLTNFNTNTVPDWANFNIPLDASGKSGNDAIRSAFNPSRDLLIEVDTSFKALREVFTAKLNTDIIRDDGIHPNVLGNVILALLIFTSVTGSPIENVGVLVKELGNNWDHFRGSNGIFEEFNETALTAAIMDCVSLAPTWIKPTKHV